MIVFQETFNRPKFRQCDHRNQVYEAWPIQHTVTLMPVSSQL